jgi:hypothetical protein
MPPSYFLPSLISLFSIHRFFFSISILFMFSYYLFIPLSSFSTFLSCSYYHVILFIDLPASCSEDTGFKSRSVDQISRAEVFIGFFLSPFRQIPLN